MSSNLESYTLSGEKLELLQQCFSEPESEPMLRVYQRQPKPSELRQRIISELFYPPRILEVVQGSVHRAWENFHDGSVSPNEFMRTPFGASYEVVANVEGKGRGIIASRDIKAGESILQESPVLVLPPSPAVVTLLFLTLPQKALHAILLLHNAVPNDKPLSSRHNIPKHRLLDCFNGILTTNSFGVTSHSYGKLGVLLLTGSLFNHSANPNLVRRWNDETTQMVFNSERDIEKGEELVIDYLPGEVGTEKAKAEKLLRNYGIGLL